jgi:tetratricopeptide (TPR) repeat protein
METLNKYTVTIVATGIVCILIIGITKIFAVDGDSMKKADFDQNDKQAWLSKGDSLNRMGNFSEAIAAYDAALKIDPNYVNALDGKG